VIEVGGLVHRVALSAVSLLLLLTARPAPAASSPDAPASAPWQYGGLVDVAYGLNFNFPENHGFRSKQTTPRTNEFAPNMFLGYLRKEPQRTGQWGLELAAQAGYDTEALVPHEQPGRDRPVPGAEILRQLARANVSYLAPVGSGLLVTAGLMKGYINYESFYSKPNLNYTRSYLTDYSPNFLFGVGARYGITENVDVGFHVMNGFQYLAHANDLPSYGAEIDWRIARRLVLAHNVYYGPDQADTSLRLWRAYSDTQLQWRGDELTLALVYAIGTERAAELDGQPRTFWTAAALFSRLDLSGPWSIGLRPEWFWDRNGRMTNSEQLLWAVTSTLEYQRHTGPQVWIARLEYRYDHSSGLQGGFFRGGDLEPGVPRLVPFQHLLLMSLVWAYDS
jgi:hypothetical protein